MSTKENLHAGHRERMIDKLLKNPDSFLEHELLEVLLYSVLPRVDTNPIAHRLLRSFGSLKNLFTATKEQLISVEGIGKKAASQILLFGALFRNVSKNLTTEEVENFYSFSTYKQTLLDYFKNLEVEQFLIVLLDKRYRVLNKLRFVDHKRDKVTANIPEIAKAFVINKPTYAIIAHNHVSDDLTPSKEDDFATGKLNVLCAVHGVTLIDHVIVGKTDALSYFMENRLQEIKDKINVEKLMMGEL